MAAFRRIDQVSKHLLPAPEAPPAPAGTFEGIPTIRRRAGDSAGPLVLLALSLQKWQH